ncbi:hypothetical protein JW933_01715, partial [candidate division FCPU426 bacterium]|nr:hypothetical protein [candidate division FCPU426 bacterium]
PEYKIYFVSLYVQNRKCLFGDIEGDGNTLNDIGLIVQECWYDLPIIYPHVHLDMFVVMPNHLHGLLLINESQASCPARETDAEEKLSGADIPTILQQYQALSASFISEATGIGPETVWRQQVEYEQVATENRLDILRDFISDNPVQWQHDPMHPSSQRSEGYFKISGRHQRN